MIMVELDSVAVQWVGQETVPSVTFTRKKNIGGFTSFMTLVCAKCQPLDSLCTASHANECCHCKHPSFFDTNIGFICGL